MNKRVLVAMSGGIDSAVAAALLTTQGFEAVGLHLRFWDQTADAGIKRSGGTCCLVKDADEFKQTCEKLEMQHYIVDAREQFQNDVLDYVVHEYLQLRSANPCVICNTTIKFGYLMQKAAEYKCDAIATGHYAKVVKNADGTETNLYKAADKSHDQSYFLAGLNQNQLGQVMMPLGELLKSNVRKMARTFELPSADRPPASGICFAGNGGYRELVQARAPERYRQTGSIVTNDGHIIGRHAGLYQYTLGQTKIQGLDKPEHQSLCVLGADLKLCTLIVGPESELSKKNLVAVNCNWIGLQDFSRGLKAKAKIRFSHQEAKCFVTLLHGNSVMVDFEEPQKLISPGEPIVFYQDDLVIGGGWIESLVEPAGGRLKLRQQGFSV